MKKYRFPYYFMQNVLILFKTHTKRSVLAQVGMCLCRGFTRAHIPMYSYFKLYVLLEGTK